MNLIFLPEGITSSIIPILTIIEHRSEVIVGCVLLGQDDDGNLPYWFVDSTLEENSASRILNYVENREVLNQLDVFLIIKEPNSLLQFNVLAAISCCNLNYSGEGGRGGRKVIELLAKYNIRTYPSEIKRPIRDYSKTTTEWHQEMKEAFEYSFSVVAKSWLPQSWGLEPIRY